VQLGLISESDGRLAVDYITRRSITDQLDAVTIDKYYYTLRAFLTQLHSVQGVSLSQLDEHQVTNLLQALQTSLGDKRPWGEETRKGRWYIFRSFYDYCVENNLSHDARAYRLIQKYRYKVDKKKVLEKEPITYEEQLRLVDSAQSLYERTLLGVLFRGGVRQGELMGLCLKDVELQGGVATIHVRASKTTPRTITLVDWSAQFLERWMANHPRWHDPQAPLFLNEFGKPLHKNTVRNVLVKLCATTGIHKPKTCAHLCRHSAATEDANYLTKAELDAKYGWTTRSNTAGLYTHKSGIRVREAEFRAFNERQKARTAALHLPEDRY
jgi:site-specific recombinase XerD